MGYYPTAISRRQSRKSRYLAISFFCNVVLAVALAFLLARSASVPVATMPEEPTSSPAAVVASAPTSPPFHWSNLVSPDYDRYAANLRAVGCPEPIITRILDGVASADPDAKAEQLQSQPLETMAIPVSSVQDSAGKQPVSTGIAPAANAIERNGKSDSGGLTPESGGSTVAPLAPPQAQVVEAPLPVVLAQVDSSLQLTPEQETALETLRDNFVKSLEKTSQNPDDPAYQQVWETERFRSNEQFRANYGDAAYGMMVQAALYTD